MCHDFYHWLSLLIIDYWTQFHLQCTFHTQAQDISSSHWFLLSASRRGSFISLCYIRWLLYWAREEIWKSHKLKVNNFTDSHFFFICTILNYNLIVVLHCHISFNSKFPTVSQQFPFHLPVCQCVSSLPEETSLCRVFKAWGLWHPPPSMLWRI